MIKFILVFFIAFQLVVSASIPNDLIITLPDGQVQGAVYTTVNNVTYYGWRGIPFATPPIGSLRFQAPKPPQSWSGIKDATNDGKACISTEHALAPETESEDCLYINVYTSSLQPSNKLPVMFWIYGGAYIKGNSYKSQYGPDFLVKEDVIVVSFNYRVGPFGFLSTEDSVIHGNAGLKDQHLALKWTHDNIALFGGDPDRITIFGQSAGGASTGLHLVSKKSAGLFQAAIVQSGSALVPFTIKPAPRSYAFSLGDVFSGGNYGNDSQKLNAFLLEKTAEEIINAVLETTSPTGDPPLAPIIEDDHEEAFLTESPYKLLESGRFNQVPIMIGICAEESIMFLRDLEYAEQMGRSLDNTPRSIIPSDLRPSSSDEDAVIENIKNIYLKGSKLFANDLLGLAGWFSDNTFTRGIIKQADMTSVYAPVYLYQYSYYGRAPPPFIVGAEKAGHTAELPFLFNMSSSQDTDPNNLLTQKRTVKIWTNFAKFLNPVPEKSDLLNNVTWPTVSPTEQPYLNINGTLELRYNIKDNSYPLWNQLYETYGKKPFITF